MKYADDAMVACVFREVPKNGKILEFEFLDERFANFFSFAGFDFVSLSSRFVCFHLWHFISPFLL